MENNLLSGYSKKIAKLNHHLSSLEISFDSEKALLENSQQMLADFVGAQEILQAVSTLVQEEAHSRISGVVTRCLHSVFDEPYDFHIDFERKRGRTEANLVFRKDGESFDPMTASGGGVIDVAAFALRMSCLMLSRPRLSRILILDEPFRFVSKDLRPRIKKLLEELSEELGMQFILITHMDELATGNVIEL